jgi:WD40 repeat protein
MAYNQKSDQHETQQQTTSTEVPACILSVACGDGIIKFIDSTYYQYGNNGQFAQLESWQINTGQRNGVRTSMNFSCMELSKTGRFLFAGGNAYSVDESKIIAINMTLVRQLQHHFLDQLFQGAKPTSISSLSMYPNAFKYVGMPNRHGRKNSHYYNIIAIKAYHEDSMIVASEDGTIKIFEAFLTTEPNTGNQVVDVRAKNGVVIFHDDPITCVALDPKNPTSIFVSDKKGRIVIYDLSKVDENTSTFMKYTLQTHKTEMSTVTDENRIKNLKSYYNAIEVDPSGRYLAAGDRHGDITMFSLKRDEQIMAIGQNDQSTSIGAYPIQAVIGGDVLKVFNGHNYYVSRIRFNKSGKYLFSVSADNILYGLKNDDFNSDESKPISKECPWREAIKVEANQYVEYELRDHWIWDLAIGELHEAANKEELSIWTVGADRIPKLWNINLSTRKTKIEVEIGGLDGNYYQKHWQHCNYSKKALTENRHDHPDLSISDKEYEKMLCQNVEYLDNCHTFSNGPIYACHLFESHHRVNHETPGT